MSITHFAGMNILPFWALCLIRGLCIAILCLDTDLAFAYKRYNTIEIDDEVRSAFDRIADKLRTHDRLVSARSDGKAKRRCMEWHSTDDHCPAHIETYRNVNPRISVVQIRKVGVDGTYNLVDVNGKKGNVEQRIWSGKIGISTSDVPKDLVDSLASFYFDLYTK